MSYQVTDRLRQWLKDSNLKEADLQTLKVDTDEYHGYCALLRAAKVSESELEDRALFWAISAAHKNAPKAAPDVAPAEAVPPAENHFHVAVDLTLLHKDLLFIRWLLVAIIILLVFLIGGGQ